MTVVIDGLQVYVAELRRDLARLDLVLAPVLEKERLLRLALIETHHTGPAAGDGVAVYRLNLSPEAQRSRFGLFAQLDDLAIKHGYDRNTRRNVAAALRSAKKLLEAAIADEQRRQAKAKHGALL